MIHPSQRMSSLLHTCGCYSQYLNTTCFIEFLPSRDIPSQETPLLPFLQSQFDLHFVYSNQFDSLIYNGHTYDICNIQQWTCLLALIYKLLSGGLHILCLFLEIDSLDDDDFVVGSHGHCYLCLLYLDPCLFLDL